MIRTGNPFAGSELDRIKIFLKQADLEYDENIEYSVYIEDESGSIMGTGSLEGNVLKCIAVRPEYQGGGVAATILSELMQYEFNCGRNHIMLYTKPDNFELFSSMGFYKIWQTQEVLLMENRKDGLTLYREKLLRETPEEARQEGISAGVVVANCNPFTRGHLYLIEHALYQCDFLHLFILSENRGMFSGKERMEMVHIGTEGMERLIIHETSDYLISAATFPTYFHKDKIRGRQANCQLDLELFACIIAPTLHITRRFVGSEPFCSVTAEYNRRMQQILPCHGILVTEIPRIEENGIAISASQVRKCLLTKDYDQIGVIVPEKVCEYLKSIEF
ncbi:[citrate (pro-3S)-lyase] ligase [Lachnospiraceae bacterium OttesenSCG-928-D06]|nr:[citrate (pro-3S)-lyase] ligase [Lachnospiraceae bacterium OttesenSCG-928-D06]